MPTAFAGSPGLQTPAAMLTERAWNRSIRCTSVLHLSVEGCCCAALFAFFAMQGSIPGIAPSAAFEITGSAPTAFTTIGGIVTQAVANAIILVLLLRHPRLTLHGIASLPWITLLAILAVASTAWSLDPVFTLRRSIPFALAGLFGLWFASRYSVRRQLAILRLSLTVVAVATIAVVLLAPSIGLDHTPGHAADWQGVFTQKNACGRIMVLATAAILFAENPPLPAGKHRRRSSAGRLAALGLFLFVLIMSGSRGAWMIEAALFVLWSILAFARRTSARARLVIATGAPLALFVVMMAVALLFAHLARLLGRDLTLSGRTAIWAQVVHFIRLRPLFGYGYDAFWRGMQGPSLAISSAVHFVVVHAHNGFLEIILELGSAGLALFLFSWFRAWRKLWPLWRHGEIARLAWPLAVLVLIALYDLDENTLLIYNGLFWVLYVAALTAIEQVSRDFHHRRIAAADATLGQRREAATSGFTQRPHLKSSEPLAQPIP